MNLEESNFSLVNSLVARYPEKITLIGRGQEISGFKSYGIKVEEVAEDTAANVIDMTVNAIKRDDAIIIAKTNTLCDDQLKTDLE